MNVKDLVKRLGAFGLDPREALVFYHLSRLGPARAVEVARASGVKRTEVYRVMETLAAKGLVERTLERPRRFVPVGIESALDRTLEVRDRELKDLAGVRDTLSAEWPRVPSAVGGVGERFSVHHGRAQIRGILQRMVQGAREEILIVALKRGLARLDGMDVLDSLAKKASGGVIVKILTEIDETNRATAASIGSVCQLRHVDLPGYHQVVIVDGSEIALFVSVDPLVSTSDMGETVLWLNAPDFILAQKALFDTMWTTALDHAARAVELTEGTVAEQVGLVRGRWARYHRLKEMLYRAKRDVLFVTTGADAKRLQKAGVSALLARRAADGVRVRVAVADADAVGIPGVEARGLEIPPLRAAMLVDETEFIEMFGTEEDPASVAYEDEWAVWVTRRADVARLGAELERVWSTA